MENKRFIVLSRTNSTTRNGSTFSTLKLANREENFDLKIWDIKPEEGPKKAFIIEPTNIREDNYGKSCYLADVTIVGPAEENDLLYTLLPHPTKKEDWDSCIDRLLAYCKDEKYKKFIKDVSEDGSTKSGLSEDCYKKYLNASAAQNVHHAYKGGLVTHTYEMLHLFEGIYPCLPYPGSVKPEYCIIALLMHDYGKTMEYAIKDDGSIDNTEHMYLMGHIFISAQVLNDKLNKLIEELTKDITEEEEKKEQKRAFGKEKELLLHCVLAHHGQLEYGSPVMPATQEAVIVNMVDNLSAKLSAAENNGHMEYVKALGTHVVKKL